MKARDLCPAWEWSKTSAWSVPQPHGRTATRILAPGRSRLGRGGRTCRWRDHVCKQEALWLPGWVRSGGASLGPFIWPSERREQMTQGTHSRSPGGWSVSGLWPGRAECTRPSGERSERGGARALSPHSGTSPCLRLAGHPLQAPTRRSLPCQG